MGTTDVQYHPTVKAMAELYGDDIEVISELVQKVIVGYVQLEASVESVLPTGATRNQINAAMLDLVEYYAEDFDDVGNITESQ